MSLELISEDPKLIIFRAPVSFTEEEFKQWKADIQTIMPTVREQKPAADNRTIEKICSAHTIIARIKEFHVESKTPLECMMWASELKKMTTEFGCGTV